MIDFDELAEKIEEYTNNRYLATKDLIEHCQKQMGLIMQVKRKI